MGFLSSNQQNSTPSARRRHFSNMRLVIALAGGYILYEGISQVLADRAGTPAWFYIYLVLFALAIAFAFYQNERRIKTLDRQIAEEEAKAARESGADERSDLDEPSDLDRPR